jgi:hypothetical protein
MIFALYYLPEMVIIFSPSLLASHLSIPSECVNSLLGLSVYTRFSCKIFTIVLPLTTSVDRSAWAFRIHKT